MECGLSNKLKLLRKIKLVLIQLGKGGDKMEQARKIMVETMHDLRAGKIPQRTAEIVHKNGHSIAQNQFAEVKEFYTIKEVELTAKLNRAQADIERL